MGGVCRQIHRNCSTIGACVGALGAEVVFHVTGALDGRDVLAALKFSEDLRISLASDVGEHVQATTVGHSNGDLVEVFLCRGLQDFIHQTHCGLSPFEAEAFLADIFGLQEGLEGFCLVQFGENS